MAVDTEGGQRHKGDDARGRVEDETRCVQVVTSADGGVGDVPIES